jgi:hypothetical protein
MVHDAPSILRIVYIKEQKRGKIFKNSSYLGRKIRVREFLFIQNMAHLACRQYTARASSIF